MVWLESGSESSALAMRTMGDMGSKIKANGINEVRAAKKLWSIHAIPGRPQARYNGSAWG